MTLAIPDFEPFETGALPKQFGLGTICSALDGSCTVQVTGHGGKVVGTLRFEVPLAVRVISEGSLLAYWNAGIRVKGSQLLRASSSEFLDWLAWSSGGVHQPPEVAHYALISDDVCVEVLSRVHPAFNPASAKT